MNVPTYPGGRGRFGRGVYALASDFEGAGGLLQEQLICDVLLRALIGDEDGDLSTGFWGDSFMATAIGGRTVQLTPGIGMVLGSATATRAQYRPVVLLVAEDLEIPETADTAEARVDLICIRAAETSEEEYRDVQDLEVGGVALPAEVAVRSRPSVEVLRVPGVEGVSPLTPDVPAGYVALAQLDVAGELAGGAIAVTDLRAALPRLFELQRGVASIGQVQAYSVMGFGGDHVDDGSIIRQAHTMYSTESPGPTRVAELELTQLPHGYTLDKVECQVNRAAAGGTFFLTVIKRTLGSADSASSYNLSVPDDLGVRWEEKAVGEVVDRTQFTYWLQVSLDNPVAPADLAVRSVRTYCT